MTPPPDGTSKVIARVILDEPGKPKWWMRDTRLPDGQTLDEMFPLSMPEDSWEARHSQIWYPIGGIPGGFYYFNHSRLSFRGEVFRGIIERFAPDDTLQPGGYAEVIHRRNAVLARMREVEQNDLQPIFSLAASLLAHLYAFLWREEKEEGGTGRFAQQRLNDLTYRVRHLWAYALEGAPVKSVRHNYSIELHSLVYRRQQSSKAASEYISVQLKGFWEALEKRDRYLESIQPLEEARRALEYLLLVDFNSLTRPPSATALPAAIALRPAEMGPGGKPKHKHNAEAILAKWGEMMVRGLAPGKAEEELEAWYKKGARAEIARSTYRLYIKELGKRNRVR